MRREEVKATASSRVRYAESHLAHLQTCLPHRLSLDGSQLYVRSRRSCYDRVHRQLARGRRVRGLLSSGPRLLPDAVLALRAGHGVRAGGWADVHEPCRHHDEPRRDGDALIPLVRRLRRDRHRDRHARGVGRRVEPDRARRAAPGGAVCARAPHRVCALHRFGGHHLHLLPDWMARVLRGADYGCVRAPREEDQREDADTLVDRRWLLRTDACVTATRSCRR